MSEPEIYYTHLISQISMKRYLCVLFDWNWTW